VLQIDCQKQSQLSPKILFQNSWRRKVKGTADQPTWPCVSRLSHVNLGQPAVPCEPGSAGCPMWTWVSQLSHVNLGQPAVPRGPVSAGCPLWTWVSWPVHVTLGQLYPWFYSFSYSKRELLGINGCAFYVLDLLPVTQPAVTCILSRACWVFLVWCYFVQYMNVVQEFCLTLTVRWRGNSTSSCAVWSELLTVCCM